MKKKESLICQNIRKLKRKKKEFGHFGNYLITFATLFGLFANLCANYIPDGFEKVDYMTAIAMILEVMYIIAISIKIASHYSIKEYVKEYEIEKLNQKKSKEVCSPLTVPPNKEEINRNINLSLANQKQKSFWKKLFWVGLSIVPLGLVLYLIIAKKISGLMAISISVVVMAIIFPILSILAWKEMCRYFLLFYVGQSKDSES